MPKQYLALQKKTPSTAAKAFYTLGESFFRIGQYDSASYYLHKSLGTRSHGIKADAYMRLADIAQAQGNTAFLLKWKDCIRHIKTVWHNPRSIEFLKFTGAWMPCT